MRLRVLTAIASSLLAALAFAAPAGSATPASGPVPQIHEGSVCKAVRSSGGWNATICAMVNENDAQLDYTAQTLITYTIRSGTLGTVDAYSLQSDIGTPICCITWDRVADPYKNLNSGKSSFLSNAWYGPAPSQYRMAGVVTNPCVSWTNGQVACYIGNITSTASQI
jgi:hypothetical protein